MARVDLSYIPDPVCIGCDTRAMDLDYIDAFRDSNENRADYIRREDGTLNISNGHFMCDSCYIKAGQPTAPGGWVAP